jgi:hypothetical protein
MDLKNFGDVLASHGASASGVAVVGQILKKAEKVSVGGRGISAHHLTAYETSLVSGIYFASEVPARAHETLARLLNLRSPEAKAADKADDFFVCFQLILTRDIVGVCEIRISRTSSFAQIIFDNGSTWTFAKPRSSAKPQSFHSEVVLSADLIDVIASCVSVHDDRGADERVIEAEECD